MAKNAAQPAPGVVLLVTAGLTVAVAAVAVVVTLRNNGVRIPAGLLERSPIDADRRPLEHIEKPVTPAFEGRMFGKDAPAAAASGTTVDDHADAHADAHADDHADDDVPVDGVAEDDVALAIVPPGDLGGFDPDTTASLDDVESVQPLMSPPSLGTVEHRGVAYDVQELSPTVWKILDPHGLNVGTLTAIASGEEGGEVFVTALPDGERQSEGTDWPTLVGALINQRLAGDLGDE